MSKKNIMANLRLVHFFRKPRPSPISLVSVALKVTCPVAQLSYEKSSRRLPALLHMSVALSNCWETHKISVHENWLRRGSELWVEPRARSTKCRNSLPNLDELVTKFSESECFFSSFLSYPSEYLLTPVFILPFSQISPPPKYRLPSWHALGLISDDSLLPPGHVLCIYV